jgi:hypothetical protein
MPRVTATDRPRRVERARGKRSALLDDDVIADVELSWLGVGSTLGTIPPRGRNVDILRCG